MSFDPDRYEEEFGALYEKAQKADDAPMKMLVTKLALIYRNGMLPRFVQMVESMVRLMPNRGGMFVSNGVASPVVKEAPPKVKQETKVVKMIKDHLETFGWKRTEGGMGMEGGGFYADDAFEKYASFTEFLQKNPEYIDFEV
jgi:hypothetical protein